MECFIFICSNLKLELFLQILTAIDCKLYIITFKLKNPRDVTVRYLFHKLSNPKRFLPPKQETPLTCLLFHVLLERRR